jgi:hypothetical protein
MNPFAPRMTRRAPGSIAVTSHITTSMLACRRSTLRTGSAISPGESAAVATW